MAVSGQVSRSGVPVRVGDKWNERDVVEMAAGASLKLMHTLSTRQWSLAGPARLVACAGGEEELVLGQGSLRTEPGAGVRPGAEVWIGTPYGSLRYADARAELVVGRAALKVRVVSGPLWLTTFDGAAAQATSIQEQALEGQRSFAATAFRASPALATTRCGRAASASEERARAVLAASSEPLGSRAAAHVRARQQAHATCSSAFAALLAGESAGGEPWQASLAELARHDQVWRGVPEARAE
jgi:hypothetical protein